MDILEGSKLKVFCCNIKKNDLHIKEEKVFKFLNNPNLSRPVFMRNEVIFPNPNPTTERQERFCGFPVQSELAQTFKKPELHEPDPLPTPRQDPPEIRDA